IVRKSEFSSQAAHPFQALSKLRQAGAHFALRGFRPARQDIRHGQVIFEAMAAAQAHSLPAAFESRATLALKHVEQRGIVKRDRLAKGMVHPPRCRYGFRGETVRTIPVFAVPGEMGEVRGAKDAEVRPGEQGQHGVSLPTVRADGGGHMVQRSFELAQMKQVAAQDEIPRQHQPGSWLPLRQSQEFEEALHMLGVVTETICEYMHELRKSGCDAVLYSINGAIAPPGPRGIDDET